MSDEKNTGMNISEQIRLLQAFSIAIDALEEIYWAHINEPAGIPKSTDIIIGDALRKIEKLTVK